MMSRPRPAMAPSSSTAPAAEMPMYRYTRGRSSRSMTVRRMSEKNTVPTCRTEAAVTPPMAAVAAPSEGRRILLNWESSMIVSRPRPMRPSRSPADMAVTHRAPTTVV